MKTFEQFKSQYESALKLKYEHDFKMYNFIANYPEYQHGLDYNYFVQKRVDESALTDSFGVCLQKAIQYIRYFNEGDFLNCLKYYDF